MTLKKILFVDDEKHILNGLRRALHSMRREWQMAFVDSGAAALELLSEQPFDVVVSDMQMPQMNGAQLLQEIKQRHPKMIRIALSGHIDTDVIMRSLEATHQYLYKPCDTATLKSTIDRVLGLQGLFGEGLKLRPIITRIQTLPSLPSIYLKVTEELQRPDANVNRVGELIAQDPAMSAKILQLINSAYFGLTTEVSNPERAVQLLGIDTVRALILSAHIFKQFEAKPADGFNLNDLWRHGMLVGRFAREIAKTERADSQILSAAFIAGILHDIGQLILLTNLPEEYLRLRDLAQAEQADPSEIERHYLGASHAEIGAYLLGLWGLPNVIVDAVANHHRLTSDGQEEFSVTQAVKAANLLAHKIDGYEQPQMSAAAAEFLAGLGARLTVWQAACSRVADLEMLEAG